MFEAGYEPKNGRLYMSGSWCSLHQPTSYIEIVLVEKYYIFAVSVQGFWESQSDVRFIEKYKISHSTNYQNWSYHTADGKEWVRKASECQKFTFKKQVLDG